MTKYGTEQYYRESIDEEKSKKEILLNALQNVARDSKDLHLIEIIAKKIVDVNVRRLRMKVEDDPSRPRRLITVWGMGYKWNTH